MARSNQTEIVIGTAPDAVAQESAGRFARLTRSAIAAHDVFSVALSCGNTPALLYAMLASSPDRESSAWGIVHLFWGDERFVPLDDPESNFLSAQTGLLSRLPVSKSNIHPMPTTGVAPAEASEPGKHQPGRPHPLTGEGRGESRHCPPGFAAD